MANPPQYIPNPNIGNRPGNTYWLYQTYLDILHGASVQTFAHQQHLFGMTPTAPVSIAIPLMGSGALGYGYDLAASAAIDALWDFWFTDPNAQADNHQARIKNVAFVVPTNPKLCPELCIAALRKALRYHVYLLRAVRR